jgi:NAD(P)H-quinone oxidoreductase subunit 5
VIAVFSKRYLEGEPRQRGYIMALAAVLLAVHILLLAIVIELQNYYISR